jgi:uncharacterized protein
MTSTRWLLAASIATIALVAGAPARASAINDEAALFTRPAVEKAKSRLDRLERATGIPVVIETIEAIPRLPRGADKETKERAINSLAKRRDQEIRDEGIFILISKRDAAISEPLIRDRLERWLPLERRHAIRDAFIKEFKERDFDAGLNHAVRTIEESLQGVTAPTRRAQGPVGAPAPLGRAGRDGGGTSMLGTFLLIGAGIFVVLLLLRLLGGAFGRTAGAGYQRPMGGIGAPGPGAGPGPGYYGGPGYGGRGGGFFSGLLGGLGGALAGNWLYDQMSGRHGQTTAEGSAYTPGDPGAGAPDQGGDAIIGAEDDGGRGASWDDGGGDTGGGDWGGGDAGGDWGGGDAGGGDWGGGGGDWGGGDGGGDW